MCGNIKKLRYPDRPATDQEVDAAVLQFIRKISNMRKVAPGNQPAFDEANARIAASVRELLAGLKGRRANAVAKATFKAVP